MPIFRLLTLILLTFASCTISAQTSEQAASLISGNVSNLSGNALAHITVVFSSDQSAETLTKQTDAYGRFEFSPVASGTYQLEFKDENFITYLDEDPHPDEGTIYLDAVWPGTISVQDNQKLDLGEIKLARVDNSDNRQNSMVVTDCTNYGDDQTTQTLSYALANAREILIDCTGTLAVPELTITKDVKITSSAEVALEAIGFNRIFRVLPGVSLNVSGIDISNGDFTDGIALLNIGTTTIENAEITGHKGNTATILNRGILNLTNVRQYRNLILYDSVLKNTGAITGTDVTIESHTSTGGPVITNDGRLELHRCQLSGFGTNNVWSINNNPNSTIKLFDCALSRSSSPFSNKGTLEIFDSSINDNDGDQGVIENSGVLKVGGTGITNNDVSGAIITNEGSAELINSTISGNSAGFSINNENYAGAISNTGLMKITTTTIANNTHRAAGDRQIGNSGELTLSNTIISGVEGGLDCAGITPVQSLGYNLHTDGTCGDPQQTDIPFGNPGLLALADNGGLGQTHELQTGSDAIDAGNCGDGATAKDQRGTPRPQGNECDIGAYELIGTSDQQSGSDNTQTDPDQTTPDNNPENTNDTTTPENTTPINQTESSETELTPQPEESSPPANTSSQRSGGGALGFGLLLFIAMFYMGGGVISYAPTRCD